MRQRLLADDPQRGALSRVLRQARQRAGLKQIEVAERLGVPQSFVSKWEAGSRRIDLIELMLICNVLGTDIRTLITLLEDEIQRGAET